MIRTYRNRETQRVFEGERERSFPTDIMQRARRKMVQISAAAELDELRVPPSNHLEALSGGRQGQHSVRVNRQWRICFVWRDGNAYEVELVDYH